MLKKILLAATATMALSGAANAAIIVSGITNVTGVSSKNDFRTDLANEGLTQFTMNYSDVILTSNLRVEVYRVASESALNNTMDAFGSGPIAEPGTNPLKSGWTPNDLVASAPAYAGSLAGMINFFSDGQGGAITFGSTQVGIFLPSDFAGGSTYKTNHLWVGFDDSRYIQPHDNHDDYIIRISAVPEPATWLTMIAGFGLVGYQLRRRATVKVSAAA